MGIFSLFGKNKGRRASAKDNARAGRQRATRRNPEATVMRIDAIESEMSLEFATVKGDSAKPARTLPAATPVPLAAARLAAQSTVLATTTEDDGADFLLDDTIGNMATPAADGAALIEECAILFANGQTELAEEMLRDAVTNDSLDNGDKAWRMLFDLYQLSGKREQFEQLAIDYANRFEASPPAWIEPAPAEPAAPDPAQNMPLVAFSGPLDAKAARTAGRARKLAETHRALRLEFLRVDEVDRAGCALLLALLQDLQQSNHELVLIGAPELAGKIRAIIEVGRRGEGEEACWLLLLEILRLLDREREFEEVSMDYCVTFEVSPPAFVTRQPTVMTAAPERACAPESDDFLMPEVVEGRVDKLVAAIAARSERQDPVIVDCGRLERIDFHAAGALLSGLAPICGSGRRIEFHHVNHLVLELFHVIGLDDIVRILPRKS